MFNKEMSVKSEKSADSVITVIETDVVDGNRIHTGRGVEVRRDAFIECLQPIIPAEIFVNILRDGVYFTDVNTFESLFPQFRKKDSSVIE